MNNANNKSDYYLGLNKFVTDGISAMNDNSENDEYKNDGIVASYRYKFNKKQIQVNEIFPVNHVFSGMTNLKARSKV